MNSIIDKIIDERIENEQFNKCKDDKNFYEKCRIEHKELEKNGVDYSKCKSFYDLCKLKNDLFIKEVLQSE